MYSEVQISRNEGSSNYNPGTSGPPGQQEENPVATLVALLHFRLNTNESIYKNCKLLGSSSACQLFVILSFPPVRIILAIAWIELRADS